MTTTPKMGLAGTIAKAFVRSNITPLLVIASLLMGIFAAVMLPREEEPQISVPMFDIIVPFPGAPAKEVEDRLASVGQRKLMEIPGVEYVYTTAETNFAMFIVRFKVGLNAEEAMTRLFTKVSSNADFLPAGAGQPMIKQRSIDDVPVLALTFHGEKADALSLRRTAAAVREQITSIPEVSETNLIGGRKRTFLVHFDPQKLAERRLTPLQLAGIITQSNRRLPAGSLSGDRQNVLVETDSFIRTVEDLKMTIVGLWDGHPVQLSEVAQVTDGQDEEESEAFIYAGGAAPLPAVTLTVAKRKGANATHVSEEVLKKLEKLKGGAIPAGVTWTVTRNYGETAKEKSDELLFHMLLATLSVTLLIAFVLGIRESLVVMVAVPVTLGLTLLIYYLFGYTLNRITLFALIFSIGILVDDAIVVVENIHRHCMLDPECPKWQADGPLYAADPGRRFRRDDPVAGRGFHSQPLDVRDDTEKVAAEGALPDAQAFHGGPGLCAPDEMAVQQQESALRFPRDHAGAGAYLRGAGPGQEGAGKNAALRQQERIPGDPQYAGEFRPRAHQAGYR